jgi:hypothetical protein
MDFWSVRRKLQHQLNSMRDEVFAAQLSAKYCRLKWRWRELDDDKRMMRTLDDDCIILCKLGRQTSRQPVKCLRWVCMIMSVFENYDESMTMLENDERGLTKKHYFFIE